MSQSFPGTIDPTSTSGTALATILSSWAAAENTLNSGASAPSYRVPGTLWLDTTTAANTILKIYDGTVWINLGFINATAHTTSKPYFVVNKNADQTSVTAGTKVTWQTELADVGSQFASSTFTCIYPGMWMFNVLLGCTTGVLSGSGYNAVLYRNGAQVFSTTDVSSTAGFAFPQATWAMLMAVGDTAEVYFTGSSTVTVALATSQFQGVLL